MSKYSGTLIRAHALTGFDELVRKHGGDPQALLRAAKMPARALDAPESTISLDGVATVLDDAARVLHLPDFSMRLAGYQGITVLGAVALIAQHSPDVREGILRLARYLPYHTPGARLWLADDDDPNFVQMRYEVTLAPGVPRRQLYELSYANACAILRLLAPAISPQVMLRHARGTDARHYRRGFSCPVHFNQPHDAVLLPRASLTTRIASDNSELRQSAERFVGNVVRRFPLDIGRQVQELADGQLTTGSTNIDTIASQLGLHERTLQRRLSEQGLVFESLIDELRRKRAAEYLGYHALPLTQVAALLGYSEQSSFIRACKRWFGKTPTQLRKTPEKIRD
jgi:AraC-like DNA-binding protein